MVHRKGSQLGAFFMNPMSMNKDIVNPVYRFRISFGCIRYDRSLNSKS